MAPLFTVSAHHYYYIANFSAHLHESWKKFKKDFEDLHIFSKLR